MTTETIPGQQAIAWIIEPLNAPQPYLTIKPEVADKRKKAGDIVTPYLSQKPIGAANEDL